MLLEAKNLEHRKYKVYDARDREIPYVQSFDTETQEVELFLTSKDNRVLVAQEGPLTKGHKAELVKVKVKIPGSYAKKI